MCSDPKSNRKIVADIEAAPALSRQFNIDTKHKMWPAGSGSYKQAMTSSRSISAGEVAIEDEEMELMTIQQQLPDEIIRKMSEDIAKDNTDQIEGNCYRYFAFASFFQICDTMKWDLQNATSDEEAALSTRERFVKAMKTEMGEDDDEEKGSVCQAISFVMNFVMADNWVWRLRLRKLMAMWVIVVQFLGPLALSFWSYSGIRWTNAELDTSTFNFAEMVAPGSRTSGLAEMGKKLLGFVFMVLFMLNAALVLQNEKRQLDKLIALAEALDGYSKVSTMQPSKGCWCTRESGIISWGFLALGPFMNCWTILGCSSAILPCLIDADNVKDVIFDALALLFLVSLDDVTGDLGYLTSIWDGELLGAIYGTIKTNKEKERKEKRTMRMARTRMGIEDDDDDEGEDGSRFVHLRFFVHSCITVTQLILLVMALTMPILYLLMGGVETLTDIRRDYHFASTDNNTASIVDILDRLSRLEQQR